MRPRFESGKWNVICDRCGLQYKNTELRDEWTGLKVCSGCWEPRHPQTLLRVPKEDSQRLPWSRPEPGDIFVSVPYPLETEDGRFVHSETGPLIYTEGL